MPRRVHVRYGGGRMRGDGPCRRRTRTAVATRTPDRQSARHPGVTDGLGEQPPYPCTREGAGSRPTPGRQPVHRNDARRNQVQRDNAPRGRPYYAVATRRDTHSARRSHAVPLASQPGDPTPSARRTQTICESRATKRTAPSIRATQDQGVGTPTPPHQERGEELWKILSTGLGVLRLAALWGVLRGF